MMILIVFCLIFFVPRLSADAWNSMNERDDYIAGKAPFFELPCMRVGGTCAKSNHCPIGMKVAQLGLCPEQQRFGMECCRPLKGPTECRLKNGECVPKIDRCPRNLLVPDASGCRQSEICCTRLESIYFEQPCMRVGGFCADACPANSRVIEAGLCPDQQIFGVECCVSYSRTINCCLRRRDCVPNTFECSQYYIIQHILLYEQTLTRT